MLILNTGKEDLLKNYGFEKKKFPTGDIYYTMGKSIKIYSLNCSKKFSKRARNI